MLVLKIAFALGLVSLLNALAAAQQTESGSSEVPAVFKTKEKQLMFVLKKTD